jgi:hypothetical protein
VSSKNFTCCAGSDRNSMSFRAAALFFEARKTTRLAQPAMETPRALPVAAGIGAVDHLSCMSAGRRRRNSRTYHGPVMYIVNSPCAND